MTIDHVIPTAALDAGTAAPARSTEQSNAIAVIWLIAITMAVRIAFAGSVGLGIDESYTVATSHYLDLSYFDHPPLAWWLSWAAMHLGGSDSAIVVRLPFILLFAVTTWLMYRLTSVLFDTRAGLWAAIMLNLSPIFGVVDGSWVLPDGPLIMAMLASALSVAYALFVPGAPAWRWWLAGGLWAGVALLSKYHGFFVFFGVIVFLASDPKYRRVFLQPWPYLATALAIGLFAPVLVWNSDHHWVSFLFQAARGGPGAIHPLKPAIALLGQSLFVAPWIWLPLMACAVAAIRKNRADSRSWFLCCLASGPILVFTLVPLWASGRTLFHWAAPGYLMLFPLLGMQIAARLPHRSKAIRTFVLGSAGFVAVAAMAIVCETAIPWMETVMARTGTPNYPLAALMDWTALRPAIAARADFGTGRLFVAGTKWNQTGKLAYALHGVLPVVCLCQDAREFGVIERLAPYAGQDALILASGHHTASDYQQMYGREFDSLERLRPIVLTHNGYPAVTLAVFLGHHFRPTPGNDPGATTGPATDQSHRWGLAAAFGPGHSPAR